MTAGTETSSQALYRQRLKCKVSIRIWRILKKRARKNVRFRRDGGPGEHGPLNELSKQGSYDLQNTEAACMGPTCVCTRSSGKMLAWCFLGFLTVRKHESLNLLPAPRPLFLLLRTLVQSQNEGFCLFLLYLLSHVVVVSWRPSFFLKETEGEWIHMRVEVGSCEKWTILNPQSGCIIWEKTLSEIFSKRLVESARWQRSRIW